MKNLFSIIGIFSLFFFGSCRADITEEVTNDTESETQIVDSITYPDWTDETHSNTADLNYDVVFNQSKVLRFDITFSSSDWSDMQSDLSSSFGMSSRPGQLSTSDSNPIWVPCSFNFNNTEWYEVGIRFKGNSSLQSAYQSGNNKMSFKLDFDQFEDEYPSLKNQRFYGFKQLNLNNNFDDASLMREKVGADLFREFGLASSQTAFCVLYVDHGDGPQYYGVYTIVEEVDDTVIETQFTDGSGNLYKPDGDAASFALGLYNDSEMEKKTNEDLADYSDIENLYNILNSDERSSNPEQWKSDLESVFNVDLFLKWLAANTVIQNWDTYGNMTHNYYLYNNPSSDLLTWIPWDNNEAFQYGKQSGALSLSLNEVDSSWPFINYLMQIDEYKEKYQTYLSQFISEVFVPSEIQARYQQYYELLKDYAYTEEAGYTYLLSNSDFDNAVETLKSHVQSRNDAVNTYLNQNQ